MSAEQSSVYLQILEHVATIRHNSNILKRRIAYSASGGGLGWKGESARRTLAASLSAHFAQSDRDEHLHIRHPSDVKTNEEVDERRGNRESKKGWEREQDGACERSDSMEPLRGRDRKGAAKKEAESYVGWYISNSRQMRKKRLEEVQQMYLDGRRFATVFKNEETSQEQSVKTFAGTQPAREGMTFSSPHRNNAQVKGSSNPYSEVHDVLSNHVHSTATPLRSKTEFNANDENAENQCSRSEPYPSSAPAPLPQPPSTPSRSHRPKTPSTVHPKFSVWPSDRTISPKVPLNTNQHRPSPALVSSFTDRSSSASSRSCSQSASRNQPHPSGHHIEEKEKKRSHHKNSKSDDNDVEFPPNHPFHGLDAEQRRTYWDTLSSYHPTVSSSALKNSSLLVKRDCRTQKNRVSFAPVPRRLRDSAAHLHGEGTTSGIEHAFVHSSSLEARALVHRTMGRVSEARSRAVRLVRSEGSLSTAVREEAREDGGKGKKSSAGRLRDTFACRPGSSTPEAPARTVENEVQPVDVAAVPRKYGMAYLARKMRHTPGLWKRSKDEQRQVHGENQDAGEAADQQSTQRDTSACRESEQKELETPNPEHRNEESTGGTDEVTNPPVQLPKNIEHTPESTESTFPTATTPSSSAPIHANTAPREPPQTPASAPATPRIRTTSQSPQPQQRRCVSSSSLTLSDRLRTTRLEDLRLRSETAQEIRNLMLDIDRDRRQSLSSNTTATILQLQQQQQHNPTTENPTQLPGGFTTTDLNSPESHSQHIPSLRDTLERHFQPRRNAHLDDNNNNDSNDNTNAAPTTPPSSHHQTQPPIRLQPSHSTLPRSYKAPNVHE